MNLKDKEKDKETKDANINFSILLKRTSLDKLIWLLNRQKPQTVCDIFSSAIQLVYALERQRAAGKRIVISFVDAPREDIENVVEEVAAIEAEIETEVAHEEYCT